MADWRNFSASVRVRNDLTVERQRAKAPGGVSVFAEDKEGKAGGEQVTGAGSLGLLTDGALELLDLRHALVPAVVDAWTAAHLDGIELHVGGGSSPNAGQRRDGIKDGGEAGGCCVH